MNGPIDQKVETVYRYIRAFRHISTRCQPALDRRREGRTERNFVSTYSASLCWRKRKTSTNQI